MKLAYAWAPILLLAVSARPAAAEEPGCHPVQGDRIRAQDLAAVMPEFRSVPAETLLAQAPLPGSQRIFHLPELQALAHRFSITLASPADTCFEWPMQPLDRALVLDAMKASLHMDTAQIEIADLITARVPPGRIEFSLSRLGVPASQEQRAPVLWRGDVVYGDGHRFAIWARVGISAPCRRVTAVGNLKVGDPISAQQLKSTPTTCFPISSKEVLTEESVVGMVPVRTIPSGNELRAEYLAPANDINRGDTVMVEVFSGGARLSLTGRAVSGGRIGDAISIRNPQSNRVFPARITGKGTAIVDTGSKGI